MAIADWFKKRGKEVTAENVRTKMREIEAEIADKEAVIVRMRAELPGQVLEGDNLAAHRIEHEVREIDALKVAKEELEAKAVELDEDEAEAAALTDWSADMQTVEEFAKHLAPFVAASSALVDAGKALLQATDGLRLNAPDQRMFGRLLGLFRDDLRLLLEKVEAGSAKVERELQEAISDIKSNPPKHRHNEPASQANATEVN